MSILTPFCESRASVTIFSPPAARRAAPSPGQDRNPSGICAYSYRPKCRQTWRGGLPLACCSAWSHILQLSLNCPHEARHGLRHGSRVPYSAGQGMAKARSRKGARHHAQRQAVRGALLHRVEPGGGQPARDQACALRAGATRPTPARPRRRPGPGDTEGHQCRNHRRSPRRSSPPFRTRA